MTIIKKVIANWNIKVNGVLKCLEGFNSETTGTAME
jgi:hypothetical protein